MALALGLIQGLTPMPAPAGEAVDLELALGIDVSGSVDPEEARLQREGYTAALVHPEVLAAIRQGYNGRIAVMYYEWSNGDHQRIVADWTVISDLASAKAFVAKLDTNPPVIGRRTSISGAIEFAVSLFDKNGYDGTRRVIDISGDGENNAGGIVTHARDAAIAKGITINGLPIVNNRPNPWGYAQMPDLDKYYLACVIGGTGAFMVVALDFDDFARAVRRKLVLEIADRTPTGAAGERTVLKPVHPRRIARTDASAFRLVQATREEEIFPPGCLVGERRVQQFMQQRGFNP